MKEIPGHHIRYARAWDLWRSIEGYSEAKTILEKEMDSAQNLFTRKEFEEFKESLEGYSEHWEKVIRHLKEASRIINKG